MQQSYNSLLETQRYKILKKLHGCHGNIKFFPDTFPEKVEKFGGHWLDCWRIENNIIVASQCGHIVPPPPRLDRVITLQLSVCTSSVTTHTFCASQVWSEILGLPYIVLYFTAFSELWLVIAKNVWLARITLQ